MAERDPSPSNGPGPPVLILGEGITALGAVRCFARGGIPAYVVPADAGMVARSRWYRGLDWGEAGTPDPETLEGRLAEAPAVERAVLFPCTDDWARAVAALPEDLRDRFPASIAAPRVLDAFVDKARFARTLERVGVPHPRTVRIPEPSSLPDDQDVWTNGAFLKPRDSAAFYRRFGVKAFTVSGRGEAAERLEEMREDGLEVVLQEYVPGPARAHVFLDGFARRGGQISAVLARRRMRMHPEDFGNSTLTESIPREEARPAIESLRALFAAVGYRGVFSAEFKEDARDGRFKLLEVNPRAWWYVDFTARCGVDVCAMAYQDALGGPVPGAEKYRLGERCIHVDHDVAAFRRARRENGVRVLEWFRPWLGAHQTILAVDDPAPALHALAGRLRRRIERSLPRHKEAQ